MTIDPRIGFWFSIVLAAIGALTGVATQLTTIFGEHTSNVIIAVCVALLAVGSGVNAILHAIPSKSGAASEFPLGPKT